MQPIFSLNFCSRNVTPLDVFLADHHFQGHFPFTIFVKKNSDTQEAELRRIYDIPNRGKRLLHDDVPRLACKDGGPILTQDRLSKLAEHQLCGCYRTEHGFRFWTRPTVILLLCLHHSLKLNPKVSLGRVGLRNKTVCVLPTTESCLRSIWHFDSIGSRGEDRSYREGLLPSTSGAL